MNSPTANPKLTVKKDTHGIWVVEDDFGRHTRIGSADNDRYVAENVRESMTYMYHEGRDDAFRAIRNLIGVK